MSSSTIGGNARVFGPVVGENWGQVSATYTIYSPGRPPVIVTSHQLRKSSPFFTGRAAEVAQIVAQMRAATEAGTSAGLCAIRGMGGCGKTELAYACAAELEPAFPDAQIVVNLRGATKAPLSPEQALKTAIIALDPNVDLPDEIDDLQGLYLSLLHGKRVLILADDAQNKQQVQRLIPSNGCALLVTSRQRFTLGGLKVDLRPLSPADATALLQRICPRIGDGTAQLAQLCGYLPLALRVSAEVLSNDDSLPVTAYIDQLARERLPALKDPDGPGGPADSVEASLQLSFDSLGRQEQLALCQLSVFLADFTPEAVEAVLADIGDARQVLGSLRRRCLVEWNDVTSRFLLHDLVRDFAAARLREGEPVRLRHATHYLQTLETVRRLYFLGNEQFLQALRLFDQERPNMEVAWRWLRDHPDDQTVDSLIVRVAHAVEPISAIRLNQRTESIPLFQAALAAARRLGRPKDEASMLNRIGLILVDLGDVAEALSFYRQALQIRQACDDQMGEAATLNNLGLASANLGLSHQAIAFYEQALLRRRQIADLRGQGATLNNMGLLYMDLGEMQQAADHLEEALDIRRRKGDRRAEGVTLNNLGLAYGGLKLLPQALECHQQALAIAREIKHRRLEANALVHMARVHADLEQFNEALDCSERALSITQEIGNKRAEGNARELCARAYSALNNLPQAIVNYTYAVEIAERIGNRAGRARSAWALGALFALKGEIARALDAMQSCVEFYHEINHAEKDDYRAQFEALKARHTVSTSGTP